MIDQNNKSFNTLYKIFSSNWTVAICYLILTFILFFSMLVLHHSTFFINLDNVDQSYAWYQRLSIDIHKGFLPLWNSNTFGGQSFAGDILAGVFYPVTVVFVYLFGSTNGISITALNYLVALHFAIGAFGAFLLLKEMGVSKISSFVGGLLYVFSGSVATRSVAQTVLFIGLALLPYPLFYLVKYNNEIKRRRRLLIYSGVALGLIILSGHIDSVYFTLVALSILEINHILIKSECTSLSLIKSCYSSLKKFILIFVVALVVALPQLYLAAQYLPNSYRWQINGYAPTTQKISYSTYSSSFKMNPSDLENFINPNGYTN